MSDEGVGTSACSVRRKHKSYNLTKRTRHKNQKGKTCLSVTANMLFVVSEYKGLCPDSVDGDCKSLAQFHRMAYPMERITKNCYKPLRDWRDWRE